MVVLWIGESDDDNVFVVIVVVLVGGVKKCQGKRLYGCFFFFPTIIYLT